jgi:hypothetical protein
MPPSRARTFSYRAGVRVRGSILACDATAGSDLIFLSHAGALEARAARQLPRPRAGKRQVLTTETTLALLEATHTPGAHRLRSLTLTAALGRPFSVGAMRLELFSAGALPGAASLSCDLGGQRVVYAGPLGSLAARGETPPVRPADALCVDGTFADPRFVLPAPAEALAAIAGAVARAHEAGRPAVVLVEPVELALQIAAALADEVKPRAHRLVMQMAAAYRAAGLSAPSPLRFAGRLNAGEVLFWPVAARDAPALRGLASPVFVLASGWASDRLATAAFGADVAVALSPHASFPNLLEYIAATGAREVAIRHPTGAALADALAARGVDAYPLGPPQQIPLF